jgi:hypothetical protein
MIWLSGLMHSISPRHSFLHCIALYCTILHCIVSWHQAVCIVYRVSRPSSAAFGGHGARLNVSVQGFGLPSALLCPASLNGACTRPVPCRPCTRPVTGQTANHSSRPVQTPQEQRGTVQYRVHGIQSTDHCAESMEYRVQITVHRVQSTEQ